MAKTANIFDQFDAPAKGSGNVFDQFDENQPKENAPTFGTTDVLSTAKRLPFTPDSELSPEARQARKDYLLSHQGPSISSLPGANVPTPEEMRNVRLSTLGILKATLPLYWQALKAAPFGLGMAAQGAEMAAEAPTQPTASSKILQGLLGLGETAMGAALPAGASGAAIPAFEVAQRTGTDVLKPVTELGKKSGEAVANLLKADPRTAELAGQAGETAANILPFIVADILGESIGNKSKGETENASGIEEAARGNGNRGTSPEQALQAEPGITENVAPATSRLRGNEGEAAPGVKAQSKQAAPDEERRVQPPLQAGPGKAEAVKIPQFTKSEEAEAFGRSNPAMAPRLEKELQTARRDETEILKLFKEKKVSANIVRNVNFRAQMLNEALDYAKNPDKANPFGEKLGATETVKPDLRGKVTEAEKAATQSVAQREQPQDRTKAVHDFLAKGFRRYADEGLGQSVLDNMAEQGKNVNDVSKQFWEKTYEGLPDGVKKKFDKYVDALAGFKVGDVIGTDENGKPIYAKTHKDLVQFVNEGLGEKPEYLEGIERGYVALMEYANEMAERAEKQKAEMPRQREIMPPPPEVPEIVARQSTNRSPAENQAQATGAGEAAPAAQAPAERLAGQGQQPPPSPMPGQAVPEHGVGAATAKEFTPAKQTVNILSRVKRSVSESTGSVKDAKDAMLQHHRLVRDARFNTLSLGKELDALADGDGQVAKRLGIKAEGKAEIPPERRMLLIHAFQQPDKYGSLLTPYEKQVVDHFRRIAKAEQIYAENSGVIDPETVKKNPNYLFQWWMNEKTGEPYSPMYGQFSKGAPQMHEKFYQNYEEGIKAGKIPATDNLGTLVGYGVEGITRAAETRNMFKSLSSIEADVDGSLLRSRRSTEAKPLRMLESWARLKDQGMTNGYVRYDHPALDKAIVFKLKDGTLMRVQGPVGVREEIFPFVKAYFESPSYKTLGHLVFSFKTLKLMGGFHIWSLNFQALAGSPGVAKIPVYNVIAGLRTIKDLGDNLRVLYRNGLALKGFEDTGDFQGGLKRMAASEKWPIRWIGKGLNAPYDFTFNVVHPAIKAFTANHVYEDLKSKMESGLGRDLTESEKNEVAKQSVKYADALFSGGDYRSQLLQTNEWMAKHYYSPEARKAWQMTLLSPEWQKEHLVMLKDVIKSISTERNKPEAYLYRRYLYGALSIYATANLYNWVMTKYMDGDGKLMIQNPSAFTVRAPWNTNGGQPVYMHPLKSIFEVPEFLSDPIGKLLNKLAPIPRTMGDAYLDIKSGAPTKKTITDAIENVGVPISGVQLFDPNQPLASQVASVAGLPAYPKTYVSQIYQKADEWQKKHGYPVRNINPAGEPSPYRDLRTALENGRMDAARDAYDQLRKGTALSAPKSSKGIAEYFAEYARRPFTGSYAKDRAFYRSLSTADKKVYDEAKKERERVRKAFFDLMRRRTITKRKRESKNAD